MHLTLNEQYTGSDININIVECKCRPNLTQKMKRDNININIVECKFIRTELCNAVRDI